MCGRTACALAPEEVVRACTYRDRGGKRRRPAWVSAPNGQQYRTSYNLAPGAHTPVLLRANHLRDKAVDCSSCESSERVLMPMKWGLTPPWHQGDPYKVPYETNNCRAEGMLEKKTFKVPLQRGNRCVILADGFFEWKSGKDGKQPYYFYFPQNRSRPSPVTVKEESRGDPKQDKVTNSKLSCSDDGIKSETEYFECKQEFSCDGSKPFETGPPPQEGKETNYNNFSITSLVDDKETIKSVSQGHNPCSVSIKQEPDKESHRDVYGGALNPGAQTEEKGEECGDHSSESEREGPRLLTMAGVFDIWKPDQTSAPLFSYSIITVSSSPDMDWCHHRMPAILSNEDEVERWLDSSSVPLKEAVSLIKPKVCLTHHAVTKQVNSSRYQAQDCIKPAEIGKMESSPGCPLMVKWLQSGSPGKRKREERGDLKQTASPGNASRVSVPAGKKGADAKNIMMNWLKSGSPVKKK